MEEKPSPPIQALRQNVPLLEEQGVPWFMVEAAHPLRGPSPLTAAKRVALRC